MCRMIFLAYEIAIFFAKIFCVAADFQSAGCSDEGCGIPCYIKPAEDSCHYQVSDPCDNGGATNLDHQLWVLNTSLVRLQEKLIQKGVIPAGNTCPPLPTISNGGVIYSDLLLSIGVVAHYMCSSGHSLHGPGRYECSVDHVWVGDDYEPVKQFPTCEASLVTCEALVPISSGHVSYTIVDSTLILPGDMASYSCEPPNTLQGMEHRMCLRNGSWSGTEPKCISPAPAASTATEAGQNTSSKSSTLSLSSHASVLDSRVLLAVAVGVPTLTISFIAAILIVLGCIKLVREMRTSSKYHSLAEREGMTVDASDIEGGSSDDNSGPGTTMIKKHKKRKPKSKVITLKAHGHS